MGIWKIWTDDYLQVVTDSVLSFTAKGTKLRCDDWLKTGAFFLNLGAKLLVLDWSVGCLATALNAFISS